MTQFTAADLDQLSAKGISREAVEAQIDRFRTGFPYLTIDSPSSVGNGILPVDDEMTQACLDRWQRFLDATATCSNSCLPRVRLHECLKRCLNMLMEGQTNLKKELRLQN